MKRTILAWVCALVISLPVAAMAQGSGMTGADRGYGDLSDEQAQGLADAVDQNRGGGGSSGIGLIQQLHNYFTGGGTSGSSSADPNGNGVEGDRGDRSTGSSCRYC